MSTYSFSKCLQSLVMTALFAQQIQLISNFSCSKSKNKLKSV